MKVLQDMECCCGMWFIKSRGEPSHAQQLAGMGFCSLTPAECKADYMDAINVHEKKFIPWDRLWPTTLFTDRMAQLYVQA